MDFRPLHPGRLETPTMNSFNIATSYSYVTGHLPFDHSRGHRLSLPNTKKPPAVVQQTGVAS